MPCCWRRSLRSMPPIPAPANSGSPAGSSASSTESADHLAELYGDPRAAKAFANMPVIIVGYSGGFVPTAWSLEVGGLGNRVRGVFLLDAVYGELDKFASWIENNRSGFFVSSYTHYTERHDRELMHMLREKGIAVSERHGRAVEARQRGIRRDPRRRDASRLRHPCLDRNPVKEVLVKMAATPALTRVAASASSPASQ